MAKANKLPKGFFKPTRRRGDQLWVSDVIHFYLTIGGRRQSFRAYTDLRASEKLRSDLRRQIERQQEGEPVITEGASPLLLEHLERLGLVNPVRRDLTALVGEWKKSIIADGATDDYAAKQGRRVTTMIEACGFKSPHEIDAEKVKQYLHKRRETGGPEKPLAERFGAQSSNHWLVSFKCFCNWLTPKILPINPLDELSKLKVDADIRRQRTAFTDAELTKLFKHLAKKKRRRGPEKKLAPLDRLMLYRLAVSTGLRAEELSSLTPASFRLDEAFVVCRASMTKNGDLATLPLRPELVEQFREYLDGKPANEPVWPGRWWRKAAAMLVLDLRDAEIEPVTSAGVRDFHSLRHHFITSVMRTGAPAAVCQKLARHSTFALTVKYSHPVADDLLKAIAALPSL